MIFGTTLIFILCKLYLFVGLTFANISQPISKQSVIPSQCYSYTTISDRSRNINSIGNNGCDTSFTSSSTWIRFNDESGTQLTTSPTSSNQCGTQVTGWYAGVMPTFSQTVTDGKVCYTWDNNKCQWSNTISVTNCGSFYVYQLPIPPICPARYCTDTPYYPTITTTISTTVTSSMIVISPQCYEYTTIDDPSRNIYASGYSRQCDQSTALFSTPRWIRFVGTGGTQIPTMPTQSNQCSADASGWYSGFLPNTPFSTVNGTVCFSWEGNPCWSSNSVQVTNCGSFYVYRLTAPVSCNLRYCTQTPYDSPPATITTTTVPSITIPTETFFSSQCYNYTIINDPTRSVDQLSGYDCDQSEFNSGPKWVRFIGEGGSQIPTVPIQPGHCGAQSPGWYSGAMPTIRDTTLSGTMCFTWHSTNCEWSTSALVTNCGSYYVYQLKATPSCFLRYCTSGSNMIVPTATTPNTPITTVIPGVSPSQCYNYATINDDTRNIDRFSGNYCDQHIISSEPMWIRFVGTGGTQIPTRPIESGRCGTQASGWYSGTMPIVRDTTTIGSVCFTLQSNICAWNTSVLVTNCGSYYVYQLRAPSTCPLRYCTELPGAQITTPITIQTTTTVPLIYSSQCYSYTTINDEGRNIGKLSGNSCDRDIFTSGSTWVRFVGAGGTQIPTIPTEPGRCETQATGWFASAMPSIQGTTVGGTVCFTWGSSICQWNTSVLVSNCGSYYVYQLSAPPACNTRYCTIHQPMAKAVKSSPEESTSMLNHIQNLFKKLIG